MDRNITNINTYKDVLIKLIPSEIVAAYMVIDGLIPSGEPYAKWLALIVSLILAVFTPLYLRFIYKVRNQIQILFTTGTFIVWLYWLGGPFKLWNMHYQPIGSILLVLWTLLIPFLNMPRRFSVGQKIRIISGKLTDITTENYIHLWNSRKMARYQGKTAYITHIDRKTQAAELDIDKGQYTWSFEWLEKINNENKGGSNDPESR